MASGIDIVDYDCLVIHSPKKLTGGKALPECSGIDTTVKCQDSNLHDGPKLRSTGIRGCTTFSFCRERRFHEDSLLERVVSKEQGRIDHVAVAVNQSIAAGEKPGVPENLQPEKVAVV